MRLLVPRCGRGGGLGRLNRRRAAAAVVAAAGLLGAGCGADDRPPPDRAGPTPTPSTGVAESGGELAVGLTEPNPAFIHPDREVPEPFARWREVVQRMRPVHYRLVVDWPTVADALDAPRGGCMRDVAPCAGYAGLKDQLAAVAAAQRASGRDHWQVLVVFTGTPDAYAQRPRGCERARTQPRSRAPTAEGIDAYRRLIANIQRAADEAGAELRHWSPWNEPNHPFGLSPQRPRCRASAPSAAIDPYVELARALKDELRDGQELVLGELAGLLQRKAGYTRVPEFIRGLPRDLVCSTRVFGQHGYVGGPDPVDSASRALERHNCPNAHEIWMTETGVGAPRRGERRRASAGALRRACRNIRRRLLAWHEDPRVTAAFQYTLREDDRFPTGLVTVDLTDAYPALEEWVAWGGDRRPSDEPPRATC